ncbi:MAG: hypothetical protein EXQ69_00430 [Acidimicrobiia bacterium]|nr:hypothetical protein [Acidimicrobiia bacterium]
MATIVYENWKSGDQAALLSTATPFTAARLAAVPTYEAEAMKLHGCYSEGNRTYVCTWVDPFRWSMLAIRVVMGPGKPESTDATFTPPPTTTTTTTPTASSTSTTSTTPPTTLAS